MRRQDLGKAEVSDYAKLAEIYDPLHHFKDYGKEAGYVVAQIRARHPAARTLLDVACGTGAHIAEFKDSYHVEGLDLSPEMLAVARRKLPGVPFHQASMTAFALDRRFDVVTCLFRSIACVRTVDNLVKTIDCMARHLEPGGLLLIEPYFAPDAYWVDRVTLNQVAQPELKVAWMYVSGRRDRLSVLDHHYLVGRPGVIEHFTVTQDLGLFERDDFRRAFDAAGLTMTYDPIGPTNVGLYVAQKKAA
jgi:ubiquinone/menaquinone biosynthesis C-methylase UbiE